MEDFENYKIFFYILIAILYFLFSGKKKPKTVQKNTPPAREVVAEKPVSTIPKQPWQAAKKEETFKKVPEPQNQAEPFTMEDVLREFGTIREEKKIKPIEKKPEIKEVAEVEKQKRVNYDEDLKEEALSLEQDRGEVFVPEKDSHFLPYMLGGKHENKYAAFLSNPEGLKTAFIAQEILSRKHF